MENKLIVPKKTDLVETIYDDFSLSFATDSLREESRRNIISMLAGTAVASDVVMKLRGLKQFTVEIPPEFVQGIREGTLSFDKSGKILGNSSTFFVSRNASWIYLWDAEGKKYKTLNASTIGEVLTVSGDTFTSRNGSWIYTWDRDGKKINTRTAR